ncbi:tRNA (N(6)-L-threonylcarbamoyladenosine(37)-C(2))-methylthiotransferase MtaB [Proteinivorax hydrogeniformans]|uniref:Threonylcarbamoyladenosine tRNA methylthiotransferase MtaB n=1 Tax=Proteinivorax hydrogeniformans TaxID=1826727 RepID=A0AAU8HWJ3_9FIRM
MSKVAFYTLGCKVNQDETDSLAQLFKQHGYFVVDFTDKASVYVINTCTVTQAGSRKSRQMIRRAVRNAPDSLVVVTGCYSQTASEEVAKIPGVDLIVGNDKKHLIVDLVNQKEKSEDKIMVSPRQNLSEFYNLPIPAERKRKRATLKIQEGCDNFCTYCIVPFARGPIRSKPLDEVLDDVKKLIDEGFKEVVLTGIHLGSYGRDNDNATSLADVVNRLGEVEGLKRVRLSSVEPTDFDEDLLKAIEASPNLCNHFHIPLQNGSDAILEKMGRKYDSQFYLNIINKVRSIKKDAAITTDIMVGFPSESEDNFDENIELVKKVRFSDIHVFKYSLREGTKASKMSNQVPSDIKDIRSKKLTALANELKEEYNQKFIGKELDVLFEQHSNGWVFGHSSNYIKVYCAKKKDIIGDLRSVSIKDLQDDGVFGEIKGM